MSKQEVSRRTLLKDAGTALAGLTVLHVAGPAQAFPQDGQGRNGEPDASLALQQVGVEVIPWLDQPHRIHPRECRNLLSGATRLLPQPTVTSFREPLRPADRPR
jgi:hypothetical protein